MHTCTKCLKTEIGQEQYDKKGPKVKHKWKSQTLRMIITNTTENREKPNCWGNWETNKVLLKSNKIEEYNIKYRNATCLLKHVPSKLYKAFLKKTPSIISLSQYWTLFYQCFGELFFVCYIYKHICTCFVHFMMLLCPHLATKSYNVMLFNDTYLIHFR